MVQLLICNVARNSTNTDQTDNQLYNRIDYNPGSGPSVFETVNGTNDSYGIHSTFKVTKYTRHLRQTDVQFVIEQKATNFTLVTHAVSFLASRPITDINTGGTRLQDFFKISTNTNLIDDQLKKMFDKEDLASTVGSLANLGIIPEGAINDVAFIIPIKFVSTFTKGSVTFAVYDIAEPVNNFIPDLLPYDVEFKLQVYLFGAYANPIISGDHRQKIPVTSIYASNGNVTVI